MRKRPGCSSPHEEDSQPNEDHSKHRPRGEEHGHGTGLPERHSTRPCAVRGVPGLDPRLRLRRRRRLRDRRGAGHRLGRARPARRHAGHPRAGGDDRPPPFGRLRPAAGLRLPRSHPCLDRPGSDVRRRLWRPAPRRPHHQLAPRTRRRHRQGLRRGAVDVRRRVAGSRALVEGQRPGRTPGGRARGTYLPRHRRAVR